MGWYWVLDYVLGRDTVFNPDCSSKVNRIQMALPGGCISSNCDTLLWIPGSFTVIVVAKGSIWCAPRFANRIMRQLRGILPINFVMLLKLPLMSGMCL